MQAKGDLFRAALPSLEPGDVVLVAAAEPATAAHMVDALEDEGHAVVGPVERAAEAVVLAGQAPVTRAIIYSVLAGRRSGRQLADELRRTFGIETLLIEHDGAARDGSDRPLP